MRHALADSNLAPEQIDYVNAHASSTQLNDSTETLALKEVFGEHARRMMVSGTKAYYGHPLGASGGRPERDRSDPGGTGASGP